MRSGVKKRIGAIIAYKKATLPVMVVAVLLCLVAEILEGTRVFRIRAEADRKLLVEPKETALIRGMKKAQEEYSYQAERDFAQSGVIDHFLKELDGKRNVRVTEPTILATVDEKGNYELWYGSVGGRTLEEYFQTKSEEYQELLGYLTVYQRVGGQPKLDAMGSQGMIYRTAAKNPETQVYGNKYFMPGQLYSCTLYYKEAV